MKSIASGIILTLFLIGTLALSRASTGKNIDAYTQYPSPHGGQGPHKPSDPFTPLDEVTLFALVAYNDWPVGSILVAFAITDAHGQYYDYRVVETDMDGVANTTFIIPPPEHPRFGVFGTWSVSARVSIAEEVCEDTLTFEVSRARALVVPVGVGVYWDSGCTNAVEKIGWGVLSPDSTSSVDIHVRNEGEEAILFLFLNTTSWNPPETSLFMTLSWNYGREEIVANDTLLLRLTLSVSSDITGITEFGFYITIFGSFYVPGDIDHNGHVNYDDLILFGKAWGSTPDSLNWNPDADFDRDNRVGLSDLRLFALYWST